MGQGSGHLELWGTRLGGGEGVARRSGVGENVGGRRDESEMPEGRSACAEPVGVRFRPGSSTRPHVIDLSVYMD